MKCSLKCFKFALLGALFIVILSFAVMFLWNWIIPPLFAWHSITFWQALGILVLSRILLGGFGFRRCPGHFVGRKLGIMECWGSMTSEEKEMFRKGIRGKCCPADAGSSEAAPDQPGGKE